MKDVEIRNKVVARDGRTSGSPSKSAVSVDLSGVLMKSVWDEAFSIRETKDGEKYLHGKLPMALERGMASYVNVDNPDLPGIYDGLPIDNDSIYWEESTYEVTDEEGNVKEETVKILKSKGVGEQTGEGLYYKVLKEGVSLSEQMTNTNTVYDVRYDFNISSTLSVPNGCVLLFNGGSLQGGTIYFNGTKLSGDVKVYSNIRGSIYGGIAWIDWFIRDFSTDITDVLNQLLSVVKRVNFTARTYYINGTINVPSGKQLIGNGCAITASGTVNLFALASNARGNIIENMTLYTEYSDSKSGSAIKPNASNGGADHVYRDLMITGFACGIYAGEVWWNNTIENVKCTTCGISFQIWATNGQSINNVFLKCYSNVAKKTGIVLAGVKNCLFLNGNNGLSSGDNSRFLQISANSVGVKFLGCNFEEGSTKYSGDTLFNIGSDSVVNFESCTFVLLTKGSTSYTNTSIIKVSNTAKVTLIDCVGLNNSMDYDLFAQNNSRIYYRNLKGMGKRYATWISSEEYASVVDMSLPASGIAKSVDNTVYIDTGLGRAPTVTFSLLTDRAIGANVIERLSSGKFKLRFFKLSDGSVLTETGICDVFWMAR